MWMLFFIEHTTYSSLVRQAQQGRADKYWVAPKQKHKKQPFADASASHQSLVLQHV